MLATIMETSDEWIRERSGVEVRQWVERGTSTLALSIPAARQAIESAGLTPADIDMVVYATMTPDYYMPGNGCLLQAALGLRSVPCFDIRQQCSGFVYGLQLADAHVRSGLAKHVLLVGAEVHSAFMPFGEASWARLAGAVDTPIPQDEWDFNTQNRHLEVLFGDGAAAVIVQAFDGEGRGVIDHLIGADGTDFNRLYIPGAGTRNRPYIDRALLDRNEQWPQMDGRYVFKMATTKMAEAAQQILARNGVRPDDLSLVLMHQANRRINEYVQKAARAARQQSHPQHPEVRQHDRRHHSAPVGRGLPRGAHRARGSGPHRRLRRGHELGREPHAGLIAARGVPSA